MKQSFDAGLRTALDSCVRDVQPSDELLVQIHREYQKRKDEYKMKFRTKKLITIAAALCLICASCLAAVQMSSVQSGSGKEITDYRGLAAAAKQIGINAKYVPQFENGFAFHRAGTMSSFAQDAQGNAIGEEYSGLNIGYVDASGRQMMLSIEKGNPFADNGMPVSEGYSSNTYKFVPADYERTDEDRAREAEGGFFISFGNEEVEENQAEHYSWQDDGLYYSLTAFDCGFGEVGMAHMAQEIMG